MEGAWAWRGRLQLQLPTQLTPTNLLVITCLLKTQLMTENINGMGARAGYYSIIPLAKAEELSSIKSQGGR